MHSIEPSYYLYHVYGINIASEIDCPELLEGGPPIQVYVRRGSVPETLEGNCASGYKYYAKKDQLLINTKFIAKILISDGRQMVYEPRPGARDYEVRLLLLGWGLGGLLQQRELLPLHAAAVNIDGHGLILCADPRVGKSTLTAAFVQSGYQFLDDNIAAVQFVDGEPKVIPGYPSISLWDDALEQLDMQPGVLQPVRPHLPKYAVDFREKFHHSPIPVGAVYILSPSNQELLSLTQLSGAEKFSALSSQVFCGRFIEGMGKGEFLFNSLINLAGTVDVFRVLIPEKRPSPQDMVEILQEDYLKQRN